MLPLVERCLDDIRQARSDADVIAILAEVSSALGFRSGYLIEYVTDARSALHIVDSSAERAGWWQDYVASGLRTNTKAIYDMLSRGGVQVFDGTRFTDPDDPLLAFARKVDMVDSILVPVIFDEVVVGLGGFSGQIELTPLTETSLQLIVYSLFAQTRSFRNAGIRTAHDPLTPREKEVIALSADGLTSQEIAERLGMAPRTVNQHVDNVAVKLGTRNRAHTVAEAIRNNMLA